MRRLLIFFICTALLSAILAGCKINDDKMSDAITTGADNNESTQLPIDKKPTTFKVVNNFDGVTMIVIEGTVSSTKLAVEFENNSSNESVYGNDYKLEEKINGSWYQVPDLRDGEFAFTSIGYDLSSGAVREWEVEWKGFYGSLQAGEYRIVKDVDILVSRGSGDYDTYYLAAEFTID